MILTRVAYYVAFVGTAAATAELLHVLVEILI